MALRQALARCSAVICRPADPSRDRQVYGALIGLLQAISPRVEALALLPNATIALDLGRILFPQAIALTQQLAERICKELGVHPAIGVAAARFVAIRAASTAGAGAAIVIAPGQQARFLAPHPITVLPIDGETIRRLDLLGLRTLGALAAVPLDALQAQFGALGAQIHRLARGLDEQPIALAAPTPQLARRRRFAGPLADRTLLERAIMDLVTCLATDLQAGGWSAKGVVLTLTPDDGEPWTAHHALVEATADPAVLIQALVRLSRQAGLPAGVEAVTVTATDLAPAVARQRDLFALEHGQADRLREVLGRLGARHAGSLLRPNLADPHARLPERRVRLEVLEPR
jgi:nucleotidyltransferase/DNA polymerase involved in DNA repair